MHPMRRDPLIRRILHGHARERRQQILEPFRSLKAAVRQQTVPTESDTQTSDDPVSNNECGKILPAKCEENANGNDMEGRNHYGVSPVNGLANPLER
jgi:hypothetical protein